MQLNIGENIKKHRKEMNLTQEELAEAFGVTVGAVSKWESGSTIPDILTLAGLADFFSISMDVLLGYNVSSKSVNDIVEKLDLLVKENRHAEAVSEAEKALVRYPGNFKVILTCAKTYHVVSAENNLPQYIRKAIELYENVLKYISQNEDPDESEFSIRLNIAELKSKNNPEDALKELERINYMGIADVNIAMILMNSGQTEKALEKYTKAIVSILIKSLQVSSNMAIALVMTGEKQNIREARDVIDWCLALYNATGNNQISYLTKMTAVLLMIKAMCLACLDDHDNMRSCISEAYSQAKKFDRNPTNEIDNRIKFWHGNSDYKPTMYDELGRGAVAAIDSLFSLEISRKLPENVSEKIKEARICWEEIKRGE